MMQCRTAYLPIAMAAAVLSACGGQTEGELVPLRIALEPAAADGNARGELITKSGWNVRLTQAQLGVAALYLYAQPDDEQDAVAQLLDWLVPVARAHGGLDPLNGKPVRAEYRAEVALDLLAGEPRELGEVSAQAGAVEGLTLELLGVDDDLPRPLHGHSAWVEGEAERDGQTVRFAGGIDLEDQGARRRIESIDAPALIEAGQTLVLRVDPSHWLADADFSRLAAAADADEPSAITAQDQVGRAWAIGLRNRSAFTVDIRDEE